MTAVLLPTIAQILGDRVEKLLFEQPPAATVELEVIVEQEHGKCFSLRYKGPPSEIVETLTKEAERCLRPPGKKTPRKSP